MVLSACNTASGAEAVSGLGRAFFYAGTKTILASNWAVHSEATTTLFKRQAADYSVGRAEALRQTQIQMIDQAVFTRPGDGKVLFSYAHPLFWAPFSLIGDGGGGRPTS